MKTLVVLLVLGLVIRGSHGKGRNHGPYIVNRWYNLEDLSETPYTDCKSTASVTKVEVIPCDGGTRCDLEAGKNATIHIVFTPNTASSKLTAVVHGVVAGVPMPFHFPQADACENSNITCPLKPGQSYFYSVQLPVLKSYPRISVVVKWELKDVSNNDVVCIEIPAKIK
jgi:Niemann-Pick C2 protein